MRQHLRGVMPALLLLFSACTETPADRVRVGTDVDAGSLDPRLMRDTTAYRVVDLVYDGLVRLDRSLEPIPGLAASWEQTGDTSWLFHLREGAVFHDGRAVTAEDVVFTYETMLDPAFGAPLRSLYAPIASIRATDAHTVRFELAAPYAPLLSYLNLGIVPRGTDDGSRRPVGSGPFRLKSWDRGSSIVLEANDVYWDTPPRIGEVEWLVVPDNTARAQAFEAGDLDVIQSPLSPQDVLQLANESRFAAHVDSGLAITYFNFNTSRPLLAEPAMRRAICHLVDQDTILEQIYEGTDERARSVLLPSSWAYTGDVRQPEFDPGAAVALLGSLGWRDTDGDGIRDRDGEPLVLELGTHSEDVNRIQTIEYLQNIFGRYGIGVELRISDWPSFSVRRDASDFDVILLGWTQLVDPDRGLYDQLHTDGGLNWGRYSSEALDALLERGRTSRDRASRVEAYREAARLIATDVPYCVLSYQGYQLFHSRRLKGFEPDPRGMLRSLARASLVE